MIKKNAKASLTLQSKDDELIYAIYDDGLVIRQTKRSDLKILKDLHTQEGYVMYVSCDFEVAYDSIEDKSGFFTGEYEGRPVIFTMLYKWADNPNICYGGGYICDDRFRDKLFGWRLWEVIAINYTIHLRI